MLKTCKHLGPVGMLAGALIVIGALNWGLVGIGYFLDMNLNLVNLILGSVMWLEAVVYILVGLSAIGLLFGGKCKACKGGNMGGGMGGM